MVCRLSYVDFQVTGIVLRLKALVANAKSQRNNTPIIFWLWFAKVVALGLFLPCVHFYYQGILPWFDIDVFSAEACDISFYQVGVFGF